MIGREGTIVIGNKANRDGSSENAQAQDSDSSTLKAMEDAIVMWWRINFTLWGAINQSNGHVDLKTAVRVIPYRGRSGHLGERDRCANPDTGIHVKMKVQTTDRLPECREATARSLSIMTRRASSTARKVTIIIVTT
jgi:hypothetical protein